MGNDKNSANRSGYDSDQLAEKVRHLLDEFLPPGEEKEKVFRWALIYSPGAKYFSDKQWIEKFTAIVSTLREEAAEEHAKYLEFVAELQAQFPLLRISPPEGEKGGYYVGVCFFIKDYGESHVSMDRQSIAQYFEGLTQVLEILDQGLQPGLYVEWQKSSEVGGVLSVSVWDSYKNCVAHCVPTRRRERQNFGATLNAFKFCPGSSKPVLKKVSK